MALWHFLAVCVDKSVRCLGALRLKLDHKPNSYCARNCRRNSDATPALLTDNLRWIERYFSSNLLRTDRVRETKMASVAVHCSDPAYDSALARWDGEGGAGPNGPQETANIDRFSAGEAPSAKNEFAQLHSRVIALETLLITLLTDASDRQFALARSMAALIAPRSDSRQHPLTIQASSQMCSLVERASQIRSRELGQERGL